MASMDIKKVYVNDVIADSNIKEKKNSIRAAGSAITTVLDTALQHILL